MIDKIKVGTEDVDLDPAKLEFNEANLTQYLMGEATWYNYFGQKLADLEWLLDRAEVLYDASFAEKFAYIKDNQGGSDPLVKSKCEADKELIDLQLGIADITRSVNKVKQHLKAWDKNHENAQSVGHTLRREMDKLNSDIRYFSPSDRGLAHRVEEIIGASE